MSKRFLKNRGMRIAIPFVFSVFSTWAAAEDNPVILTPGTTLDYGMSLNGQRYLALHRDKAFSWQLTAVSLVVTQVDPDTVLIASAQPKARKYLQHPSLQRGNVKIAALKDLTQQQEGAGALTALMLLNAGDEIQLGLASQHAYLMKSESAIVWKSQGAQVVLSESAAEYPAELEWAGDLDGDDLMDLIMSFERDHSAETCLFLSSKGNADQPLVNVGCSMASG